MDLNSYAELAVRLVNTAGAGGEDGDRLTNLDGLRVLVADREHLATGVTRNDLDSLRGLRGEFRAFFMACAQGDGEDAAARLNALIGSPCVPLIIISSLFAGVSLIWLGLITNPCGRSRYPRSCAISVELSSERPTIATFRPC